jgi:hypothetical protein
MTSSEQSAAAAWNIRQGCCFALFAYDAARAIRLDEAERRIHESAQRQTMPHKRRAPSYFEYEPPPLRIQQEGAAISVKDISARTTIDVVVYDFGALAVVYAFPLGGPFSGLLDVAEELYDNEFLLADSRLRVEQLLRVLGDAAVNASIAPVVEDYVIFHIQSFTQPFETGRFYAENGRQIAQILRAERQHVSDEEFQDAVAARISFGVDDLTVIDWNAALLVDGEGEDVRSVLEFANVELLEMRFLDQKLDRALDEAYDALSHSFFSLPRMLGYYRAPLRRIAELQIDNALLFEGVNNTLKLLGDQYLARVYQLINRRFHLSDWDSSILRKLQTLESIYDKVADQATNRRMEVLEWVIVILIAAEIVLELVRRVP